MSDWQAGSIIAAVLQANLLGSLLLSARERPADRFLGMALLVLAGMLLVFPLGWHGRGDVPVWLALLPINLPLALGPLLYLHVRSTVQPRSHPFTWPHFVPTLLQLTYLATLSLLPTTQASAWKTSLHDPAVKPAIEFAVLVSLGCYSALSLIQLRSFRRRLRAARSDADRHDARWLSRLLSTLLLALILLCAVRGYGTFVGELEGGSYLLWLAAWSAWLGIEGWRVAHLRPPEISEPHLEEPTSQPHDWQALGAEWLIRTREAGWWRDPELSLAGLARHIGTNSLYLSRAVNEGLGMNFNEMVNRLRSEEVARVMREGSASGDLLTIALDAGFNSKATFNRSFRASYEISPSEYRRRLRS